MLHIPPPFETVRQVALGLHSLHVQMQAARDWRGLFVTAYVAMTDTIGQWIKRGVFSDNQAMSRYVVAFANEYRSALNLSQSGQHENVPLAWRRAFEICDSRNASVFQCLMLGINAHMNRDLPYAVVAADINLNGRAAYDDHMRINEILRLNIPRVRKQIAQMHGDQMPSRCGWASGLVDMVLSRRFSLDRKRAWKHALMLTQAHSPPARIHVDRVIERYAALTGEAILNRAIILRAS